MIGQTLWTEFFANRDWPVASAVAVVLLSLLVVPIVIYQQMQARDVTEGADDARGPPGSTSPRSRSGLAFLYLPIVILVIYSFNASRLVTVWGGWSTRWYVALSHDSAMLEAAWVTLRIAVMSATVGDRARHARRASRWCGSAASAAACCSPA